MTRTIQFDPLDRVEDKKRAINTAMQSAMPFELKQVLMTGPGDGQREYTGGFTQMILAKAATLEYSAKCTS